MPLTLPQFTIKPHPHLRPDAERQQILAAPGFGRYMTDHMVTIRWTGEAGWHNAELGPYAPLTIDPATTGLHYGQSIFEGLKAYRQPDGAVALFRPEANAHRFQASARRMAMPELPVELFMKACELLVSQDRCWVPDAAEHSLYLRPLMFATESTLSVRPSTEYLFLLIASPAGSYFPEGIKPLSVWIAEDYVRAAPGGTGAAKFAGNYAAAFLAQNEATEHGCAQVVWLDAIERRWIEEVGAMNLFFVRGHGPAAEITTPALTGSLLPGITRDCVLTLARDLGHPVSESRISLEGWRAGAADGSITEVFACGTAAVITPVGRACTRTTAWQMADGRPGPLTLRLREELLAIQTGRGPDPHRWLHHPSTTAAH